MIDKNIRKQSRLEESDEELNFENFLLKQNLFFKYSIDSNKEELPNSSEVPRLPILILTCMDSRIDVNKIFQLEIGDIDILRNAGNVFTADVLRSLIVSIHKHNIKLVIVLGHLDCKMANLEVNSLYNYYYYKNFPTLGKIGKDSKISDFTQFFKVFRKASENVKTQVKILEKNMLIPKDVKITGMLYDPNSGFVFDYNDVLLIENANDFETIYNSILSIKLQEYNRFVKKQEIKEEPVNEPEKTQNLDEKMPKLELIPKFSLPLVKIKIPKVRISIPKIYNRFLVKKIKK